MSFHAKKSPSVAHQFFNCPGSLAFADSLPEGQISAQRNRAGMYGTAAHFLLQMALTEYKDPFSYVGKWIGINPGGDAEWFIDCTEYYDLLIQITDHNAGSVKVAYDYVCERHKELKGSIELESRTNPFPERKDTSGTADVTLCSSKELEVIDYKNGKILVEVEDNEQVLLYLLGKAKEAGWKHKRYRITIIQPNAAHGGGAIRFFPVSKEYLKAFEYEALAKIESCDIAHNELETIPLLDWAKKWLKAGNHCLWCKGQGPCPARKALTAKQLATDFEVEVESFEEFDDIEEAAKVVRWARQIRAHLTHAEQYLEAALKLGRDVPGYHLAPRNSHRIWAPWIPQKDLLDLLLNSDYFGEKEKQQLKDKWPLTGPQAEKLVSPALRDFFSADYLYKPEGELVLTKKVEKERG